MTTILLENLTGVRIVRAFTTGAGRSRMDAAFFQLCADLHQGQPPLCQPGRPPFLFINLFIVIVYWLSGGRISTARCRSAILPP